MIFYIFFDKTRLCRIKYKQKVNVWTKKFENTSVDKWYLTIEKLGKAMTYTAVFSMLVMSALMITTCYSVLTR